MEMCGIKLKLSTSSHPKTDGASEVMKRIVENYLRCYLTYNQEDWDELIPAAKFAYKSAVSYELEMTPFERDLGGIHRSILEMLLVSEISLESLLEFNSSLETSLENSKYE